MCCYHKHQRTGVMGVMQMVNPFKSTAQVKMHGQSDTQELLCSVPHWKWQNVNSPCRPPSRLIQLPPQIHWNNPQTQLRWGVRIYFLISVVPNTQIATVNKTLWYHNSVKLVSAVWFYLKTGCRKTQLIWAIQNSWIKPCIGWNLLRFTALYSSVDLKIIDILYKRVYGTTCRWRDGRDAWLL